MTTDTLSALQARVALLEQQVARLESALTEITSTDEAQSYKLKIGLRITPGEAWALYSLYRAGDEGLTSYQLGELFNRAPKFVRLRATIRTDSNGLSVLISRLRTRFREMGVDSSVSRILAGGTFHLLNPARVIVDDILFGSP